VAFEHRLNELGWVDGRNSIDSFERRCQARCGGDGTG
jgi:hypothetical protein